MDTLTPLMLNTMTWRDRHLCQARLKLFECPLDDYLWAEG